MCIRDSRYLGYFIQNKGCRASRTLNLGQAGVENLPHADQRNLLSQLIIVGHAFYNDQQLV